MNTRTVVGKYEEAVRNAERGGMVDRSVVLGLLEAIRRWEAHSKLLAEKTAPSVGNLEDYDPWEDFADTAERAAVVARRDLEKYGS